MKLALFDLDHTILDVDSDYLWAEFLMRKGLVDKENTKEKNDYFYNQYIAGKLDPVEYVEYVAVFLSQTPMAKLLALRDEYIKTDIQPKIRPLAIQQIEYHQKEGHEVVLSSATNDFIVAGVAQVLEIPLENILASKLGIENNAYTGKLVGTPNFQAGKVANLHAWLAQKPTVTESWGYSDSHNDIPLLEFATHAFAVTPDETLKNHAHVHDWQVLDWAI